MNDDLNKSTDFKSWNLLEKVLFESIKEQRRGRRWGIFFKILGFLYLFFILYSVISLCGSGGNGYGESISTNKEHIALIKINGVIDSDSQASAENIINSLKKVSKNSNVKAIILDINSPGGSPVQSSYIVEKIDSMSGKIPFYAVINDLGASGAYYIASAANYIYADKSSLVGSIGVTAASFGYTGIMEKIGVERRLYTAGEHKAFLDPFSPQKDEETTFWNKVLGNVHEQFIAQVKKGRGDLIKDKEHPEIYSGLIWTGSQALDLGLIDGIGSVNYVSDELIKAPVVDYSDQQNPFEKALKKFGIYFTDLIQSLTFTKISL